MNTYNGMSLIEFMPKTQVGNVEAKRNRVEESSSFSQFKDIISSTVKRQSTKREQIGYLNQRQSQKTNYEKFVSISRKAVKNVENYENDYKKISSGQQKDSDIGTYDVYSTKDGEENSSEQVNTVVNTLAGLLGITGREFMQLLNEAGIDPEALTNTAKAGETVDMLASLADLTDEQKDALSTAIDEALKQLSSSRDGTSDSLSTAVEAAIKESKKVQNEQVKLETLSLDGAVSADSFSELQEKIKERLQELSDELAQNPKQAAEQLNEEIKKLIKLSDLKTDGFDKGAYKPEADMKQVDAASIGERALGKEKVEVEAGRPSEGKQDQNTSEEGSSSSAKFAGVDENQLQDINADSSFEADPVNLQTNTSSRSHTASETAKIQKEGIPLKNEILNQVIEKAKVILSPEKSEMVMDLKPDNLGKLTLKVVTERGLVVARFIAENQQVKEVLESNMQILKDSLEKQGLMVQGFSVSVGQDSQKGFNMGRNFFNEKNQSSREGGSSVIIGTANAAVLPEESQKLSPYNWNESKINLTA